MDIIYLLKNFIKTGPYFVFFLIIYFSFDVKSKELNTNNSLDDFKSNYGDYLAGSYAVQLGDAENASRFYKKIIINNPENFDLKITTIKLLLISGSINEAKEILYSIKKDELNLTNYEIIKIFSIVIDAKEKKYETAIKKLANISEEGLGQFLKPILFSWLYTSQGKEKKLINSIEKLDESSKFVAFNKYHKALIYDLIDHDETINCYKELVENDETRSIRAVQAYALFLRRIGKQKKSEEVLNNYLNLNSTNPILQQARHNYFSKKLKRNVSNTNQGLAEVFYATAKALSDTEDFELSVIFTRFALILRPGSNITNILLNEILEQKGKWNLAITPLKRIESDTPLGEYSIIKISRNLNRLSRLDEAFDVLNEYIKKNPGTVDVYEALGDLYRSKKMWLKAAENYIIAVNKKKTLYESDWKTFYSLGISFERAKKWNKAEPNFKKALELKPDQPLVMNYLAYSWVDQGKNLDAALDMIRKAVSLRPRDGYIVDSLGWAFYRLGDFDEAVKNLERAVMLEPEDAVINEHLGDAYWRVGRFKEAKYQWMRALEFGPEKEIIPKIKMRIEKGLNKI